MNPQIITLICAVIAQAIVIITVIWKAASTVTRLEITLDSERKMREKLESMVSRMQMGLENLSAIPLQAMKIAQIETALSAATSRIRTIEEKVYSLDKFRAVTRAVSQHEINDTDPPPSGDEKGERR